MDFLSETTKKERRNLLAAGFAGIIVARIKIYPTEIDLVGLRFTSPELPWIAVGALTLAITYSLAKFVSSFLYESSHAKTQNLFTQIHEGAIGMNVFKKEQELNDWALQLIEQRKVLQGQIEHEKNRLTQVEEKFRNDAGDYKKSFDYLEALSELDTDRATLTRELTAMREALKTDPGNPLHKLQVELMIGKLKELEERGKEPDLRIAKELKTKLEDLDKERNRFRQMFEQQESEIIKNEEIAFARNKTISEWKKSHNTERIISPFHSFLELYLPVLVGLAAIASLVWLIFHFPPALRPPSLPEF